MKKNSMAVGTMTAAKKGMTAIIKMMVPIKLAKVVIQERIFCGKVLSQTSTSLANLKEMNWLTTCT